MNEFIMKLTEEFACKDKLIDELKKANLALLSEKAQIPACPFLCSNKVQTNSVYGTFGDLECVPWSDISIIARSGKADKILSLGAVKTVTLKNGEEIKVRIIGFNHDGMKDGSLAGITFETVDLMREEAALNDSYTNKGGWEKTALRNGLNAVTIDLLPDELKAVIKPVVKITSKGGGKHEIGTTVDRLFLLSEQEVFGRKIYSDGEEGRWYDWYRQENVSYAKFMPNGEMNWRWLRSPNGSNTTSFGRVGNTGFAGSNAASNSFGVSFGFCV